MSSTPATTPKRTFPYTLSIEKRVEDIPRWLPAATSLGSVVIAFVIAGIILKIIGGQPLVVLRFFFDATFGSWPVFSDTLVKASPLLMVGLACTVAFKMK
ncbi:MAG: ABC transporter permease, partial [Anaerolineales bacterium]|nr:ABC transporter permease [Anaerolineales bacterium]